MHTTQNLKSVQVVAWVAIVAAWITALFVNDRTPVATTVYVALLAVALGLAVWRFVAVRDWPLLVAAVITLASWPIALFIVMGTVGI